MTQPETCPISASGVCAIVLDGGTACWPGSCAAEWRVTYVNRNNERTIWEQCGNDEAVADRELAKAVAAGRDDRIRKESRPAGGVWPSWEEE